MSYSRATATATLLFILATTGVPARSLPWETEGLGHLQQKRETDGLRPHEEETNRLITQLDDLATNLRERLANMLNITTDSLAREPVSLALGNMCTMRQLLKALDAAEASQFPAGCAGRGEDLEISVMQILVKKSYQLSCDWMVSEVIEDGSQFNAGCTCATPSSGTAVRLCTYWDALQTAKEAQKYLNDFLPTAQ